MKPIALVIPWFGENLKGGAEQQAWQIANRLVERGHNIEILTTCCAAFHENWSVNHLSPGKEKIGNLTVRRFKVDKRNGDVFNRANEYGLAIPSESLKPGINPFTYGKSEEFVNENINSLALERYLKRKRSKYHCFLFIPYLYGITLNGLPLVAQQSWLQPCLHDEVYAYLPQVERCMRLCRGILYNSEGEQKLALDLFGPGIQRKGKVVGEGIEQRDSSLEAMPRRVAGLDLAKISFVLCLGRRDDTKNTGFLVEAYKRYSLGYPQGSLNLILAGPGDTKFGAHVPGVYDLGLVSDEDKEALLARCTALFQPSKNESYSRVIMEAWGHGRPVAAQRRCLATSTAIITAEGGWLADGVDEWSELFHRVEVTGDNDLEELGRRGREYAGQFADWDKVLERYEVILELDRCSQARQKKTEVQRTKSGQAIHQLTPGFAYGDAISNQAMLVRDLLREKGYRSEIFTEHLDPTMRSEAKVFLEGKAIGKQDGIIYHHSIGAGLTDFVIRHQGPKSLVYHNVTPPDLVRDHEPELAKILEKGLDDLKVLAPHFPVNVADSQFNCNDLAANGFQEPTVLPICIMPEKWNIPADPAMMARLRDGKDNILFVGRLVANKCQHHLIEAFAVYHAMYGNSRLVLVGGYIEEEKYYQSLLRLVHAHGLEGDVLFAGKVSDSALHACYRCSHLYWSMSLHEGFGVPLIESMWFDIPVFSYKSSAIPETLGQGGLLFTGKDDFNKLAATARLLIHDDELRNTIVAAQQARRKEFLPEVIEPKLDTLIRRMNDKEVV